MPSRRRDHRIGDGAMRVLFSSTTSGETLPFGVMRPLLLTETWQTAISSLTPAYPKPGVWFMSKVPLEWIVNREALEQAGSIEVKNWSGVLKMPDPATQQRLQGGSASKELPVDLSEWGPFYKNFGVRVLSQGVQAALRREAAALGVPGKDIERLTLGSTTAISMHGEITRGLNEACRSAGNYLGPLCVLSTAQRPVAT